MLRAGWTLDRIASGNLAVYAIDYGFNCMKLRLMEAILNPNHIKSIKLLERNAFIRGKNLTEIEPDSRNVLQRVIYSLENKVFK